jgi:hypothetical protein
MKDKFYYINEIANAILRGDRNYTLDVKNDATWIDTDTINLELPTPQLCGTITQQHSYARDKAEQFLNTITS